MIQDLNKHIAVSSLESPHHATSKDPKIISVVWNIGKRCNFDCSYCSPLVHDNYSPHIDKQEAFNLIDQLENQCNLQQKKFKISITGGEPFVHPNFLEILKYIHDKKNLTQLTVVSNGSLPYELYKKSSLYLTNLTISLHLEQDSKKIEITLQKILDLNKIDKWFFQINLMFFPGKLELIKSIVDVFNKNNVKFILRKIDPPQKNSNNVKQKKISSAVEIKKLQKNFIKDKIFEKTYLNNKIDERQLEYYSNEELNYFEQHDCENQWKNIKLHFLDKVVEVNTDELKSKNLNTWKGWKCYVGIDSIYILHTGEVFRSNCMQGEMIGKIGEKLNWPQQAITCPIKWCTCNADMVIRKAKNNNFLNLIDD